MVMRRVKPRRSGSSGGAVRLPGAWSGQQPAEGLAVRVACAVWDEAQAGHSGMGKALLALGDATVLDHVVGTLRHTAVTGSTGEGGTTVPVLVVVDGHDGADAVTCGDAAHGGYHQALRAAARRLGHVTVCRGQSADGGLGAVLSGVGGVVATADAIGAPHVPDAPDVAAVADVADPPEGAGGVDGVLVWPVAAPLVRASTCAQLIAAFRRFRAGIVYPVLAGERGYPVIVATQVLRGMVQGAGCGGLREQLQRMERQGVAVHHVDVADEGILTALATPADYQQVRARLALLHIPTPREQDALLDMAGTPQRVRAHCRRVARAALALAAHLEATRQGFVSPYAHAVARGAAGVTGKDVAGVPQATRLDRPLMHAAACLHDICKGMHGHEEAGGALLVQHGFPEVARIVAAHGDVAALRLGEAELVMLADRYVRGESLVPLEERFDEHIRERAHEPHVVADLVARKERAMRLRDLFEQETGTALFPLLQRKMLRGTP